MCQRAGMGLCFKEIESRLQIGVGTAHCLHARFVSTRDASLLQRSVRPESRINASSSL